MVKPYSIFRAYYFLAALLFILLLCLLSKVAQCAFIILLLKVQYEFIHYALSELVVCGETEMAASSLKSFTDSLTDPEDTSAITLIRNHLQVQRLLEWQ